MKTNKRSTGLQAIMRNALLFVILLSFPTTIMAFEETLDNGYDKIKYSLSGDLQNEGRLSNSRIPGDNWSSSRTQMIFNQPINLPIDIKVELVSGINKKYRISVSTTYNSSRRPFGKEGPQFSVNNEKLEERINIPEGTTSVEVLI